MVMLDEHPCLRRMLHVLSAGLAFAATPPASACASAMISSTDGSATSRTRRSTSDAMGNLFVVAPLMPKWRFRIAATSGVRTVLLELGGDEAVDRVGEEDDKGWRDVVEN